jgi:hypothetical protein
MWFGPEPVFVDLLRSPESISSLAGASTTTLPIWRTVPPGYIGWRNRFLGSINIYKYGLRSPTALVASWSGRFKMIIAGYVSLVVPAHFNLFRRSRNPLHALFLLYTGTHRVTVCNFLLCSTIHPPPSFDLATFMFHFWIYTACTLMMVLDPVCVCVCANVWLCCTVQVGGQKSPTRAYLNGPVLCIHRAQGLALFNLLAAAASFFIIPRFFC